MFWVRVWTFLGALYLVACNAPVCGDGIIDTDDGEACDDGNILNGDGCQDTCQLPVCGDGVLDIVDNEQCDDGNNNDTDACPSNCQNAVCGDGFVHLGVEVCDDGNANEEDACLPNCSANVCGDGILDATEEECDDGNTDDADDCRADCFVNVCGDGALNPALEACDDGNNVDDDGCDADCSLPEVLSIEEGESHSCVVFDDGSVRCWGLGTFGRLGYANQITLGDNETPASLGFVNIGAAVEQISLGALHTCALLRTGDVRCWGRAADGQLGYGNINDIGDNEAPFTAGSVNVGGSVAQVSAGGKFTCALLTTGDVRCWGRALDGELGYGNESPIGDSEAPATAGDVPLGAQAVQLSTGNFHSCVLLTTGNVRCWGEGTAGRLGYGNQNDIGDDETPASAGDINLGGQAVQIAVGSTHNCALLTTGNVRCWGDGDDGQLGYGNQNDIGDDEPAGAGGDVNVGGTVVQIAVGLGRSCALLTTGNVRCWGFGLNGELGYGNLDAIGDDELPFTAGDIDLGGPVVSITADDFHTCAILATGRVRCWGSAFDGRLGYGNTQNIGDNETPASAGDVPLQ